MSDPVFAVSFMCMYKLYLNKILLKSNLFGSYDQTCRFSLLSNVTEVPPLYGLVVGGTFNQSSFTQAPNHIENLRHA